jgi:endonuclease V-like protein UPF0215 family
LVTSRNRCRRTTPELAVIGVDDGAFIPNRQLKQRTILVAVLFRDRSIRAVRIGRIEVDGNDALEVLRSTIKNLKFHVILLSGISFAGFNLIDIAKLAQQTRRPVIAVTGSEPENRAVEHALRAHFADWKERLKVVNAAGRIFRIRTAAEEPPLYFEVKGASRSFAERILRSYSYVSRLPEPIRVAGMLAKGLSRAASP